MRQALLPEEGDSEKFPSYWYMESKEDILEVNVTVYTI